MIVRSNPILINLLEHWRSFPVQKKNLPFVFEETGERVKTGEESLRLRKSCHHKWNIIEICNEQLQDNCLQQLATLRLKTKEIRIWGNKRIRAKGKETLKLQHSSHSPRQKFNFIVILWKIFKKQRYTFSSNQYF